MHVAAMILEIRIPGAASLKQKRSRLKSLLNMLHRKFNLAAAEIDDHDIHTLSMIACVTVSNESGHSQRVLAAIPAWIETNRPDIEVIDHEIQML